jgi:hypothetical protein
MNSAASRQVETPPMPEIGRPGVSASRAISATIVQRDRLDRRAAHAAMRALAVDVGIGAIASRSTPMIELMVLISDTASAPPASPRGAGADVGDVRRQLDDDRHARMLPCTSA